METVRTLPFPTARRSGLDALRAVATVLVVMLHAAVPYTVAPMPGLAWPVRHAVVSPAVDVLFWGIEGCIMPLFLFLSGYGAAQSLRSKPNVFLSSRWNRLGWPLLAAMIVILPIEFYTWLVGWALDGQIEWVKLRSLHLKSYHEHLWGLSHLWYLEYLLLYSTLLWLVARPGGWGRPQRADSSEKVSGAAWLAAPAMLGLTVPVLWLAPEVIVGFQHGFLPSPAKFVFSGLFFFAGALEHERPTRPLFGVNAGTLCCGLLLAGLLPLIHRQAAEPLRGAERALLATGMAAYAVLVTRTAWQAAWNSQRPAPRGVDLLAQASFWTYLVHHPLVVIGQIALRPTGWPALAQFAICTLSALAVSLGSYELIVRRARWGTLFAGRPAPVAPEGEIARRRAA